MPHKRNPITAERVCGMARVVKANAQVGFDDVALWHERDIIALLGGARRAAGQLHRHRLPAGQARVDPRRARGLSGATCSLNLEKTRGLIYSSRVLLALVDTGMSREDAYAIVQRAAMKTWADIQEGVPGPGFRDYLDEEHDFPLDFAQMEAIFDPRAFLARKDVVFERLAELEV